MNEKQLCCYIEFQNSVRLNPLPCQEPATWNARDMNKSPETITQACDYHLGKILATSYHEVWPVEKEDVTATKGEAK